MKESDQEDSVPAGRTQKGTSPTPSMVALNSSSSWKDPGGDFPPPHPDSGLECLTQPGFVLAQKPGQVLPGCVTENFLISGRDLVLQED